jgi:hypothetical protein
MTGWRLDAGKLRDAWLAYPTQHREIRQCAAGKPIFIGGAHRSGTTWFAQMLAVPGLWYIHEPFNPNKEIWQEAFSYVRPGDESTAVNVYFRSLLQGEFRETANMPHCDHPLMPLRLMKPSIQRTMIKDPLACLLTGYRAAHFDILPIVLFRHPAGFVASVTRLGWPVGEYLSSFLKRADLMEDHLEPYRELMEKHQHSDGIEAAALLHGVLNVVQWNQIQANPAIRYYVFEELCQDPLSAFEKIFRDLNLPYNSATRDIHTALCLGGSRDPGDYHTHAVARNSIAMADSWKRQLDEGSVETIMKHWQLFSIPLYET